MRLLENYYQKEQEIQSSVSIKTVTRRDFFGEDERDNPDNFCWKMDILRPSPTDVIEFATRQTQLAWLARRQQR